ncbi:MAG: isocitrate/isopropylmalate dehydrogenase family protein [Thermoplasmata archaeon]|uniref:Isocitrate/isopropylmalate dehydrogenase family protein n=1 Tax=Candidatus Sysuiplasma superficiale TaxID=2823368 RepID=A0A8J7YUA5_9ARCH|nr:isocitrate/isopropylmalate dehydrogenase family protein [Candidatus Sysuiplasma superficiale]MBX8644632.1 isocitrate/isopropylmalate dehydrogenase family protein [Candidatus Sysuiplasma superficiale]
MSSYRITLIPGDGIGPEVTDATVKVLEATGINFEWDVVEAGEKVIAREGTPLPQQVLDSLKRNRVGIKGPLTTPIGGGFRSVNVALRQMLDLYASVRPARSIAGEGTLYTDIDLVVIREATEELYSGVEHWIDREHSAAESISIVTRKASERIVRYAFEYAVREKRRKVTSVHKANILKTTGALFQEVSQKIAREYPQIQFEERLIDNMAMQLVKKPQEYDVIVTTNLFGDILSDLCSGLAGGLGITPGAIIGDSIGLFEPVHGSAPKYAGQDRVNPVATILSGEMMLRYLGERQAADRVWNAVYDTIKEKKFVTYDLALPGYTQRPVQPSTCSRMAAEIAKKVRENS